MRAETENTVAAIRKSLSLVKRRMDWETASHRLEELNAMTEDPNLWNDATRAQKLMRDRQTLADAVARVQVMERDLDDNVDLIELGEMEDDKAIIADAEEALKRLRERAEQAEIEALLNGEADGNDTFLEINAGAGGTESCDWAAMLARMYVRWAEQHGYKVELISESAGEEAGIKSAAYKISGHNAYGWLKSESGVHRLVRISPYDSSARRHTSFSSVWVYPRGGREHRDRHPRQGYPDRHLPVLGRGRPACEHDRLCRADHAPAHEHRRDLVDEVAAPEPRSRDERAARAALPDGARPPECRDQCPARRKGRCGLGQPDPLLRAPALPDGEGSPHGLRDLGHARACSTAISTASWPRRSPQEVAGKSRARRGARRGLTPVAPRGTMPVESLPGEEGHR
jgi:hypothetical protein